MPEVKIRVPYERKIHFIWWGDPRGNEKYIDAAFSGPNSLAENHGNWRINYWFQAEHEKIFDPKGFQKKDFKKKGPQPGLHPAIIRRRISDRNILDASDLSPSEKRDFASKHSNLTAFLPRVIQGLETFRAHSAIVDLLQMVILFIEGGYYFDTSIYVPDHQQFYTALANESLSPRFVEQGGSKPFGFENRLDVSEPKSSTEFQVPNFDYWVLFAKPRDTILKSIIDMYLIRCAYGGIKDKGEHVSEYYLNKNRKLMDIIVGRLIAHSVWDGLYHSKRREIRSDGMTEEQINNDIFNKMLNHAWTLIRSDGLYEFMTDILRDDDQSNHLITIINDLHDGGVTSLTKFCERYRFRLIPSGVNDREIAPGIEFVRKTIANSKLVDEVDTMISKFYAEQETEEDKRTIINAIRSVSRNDRINYLKEARSEALRQYFNFLQFNPRYKKLFSDKQIATFEEFKKEMKQLAPKPLDRKVSSWHSQYNFFKYNAGTWRTPGAT
jgi:hypothetical protein